MKTLVTHSGKFHADDVFATAVLKKIYSDVRVVRSRDSAVIEAGDIVYDVGQVYDSEQNRFDHHQKGGAGARDSGIPYAAFGLIWKHFGLALCSSESVWNVVDEQLVSAVDAVDTGYASPASATVPTLSHYTLDSVAGAFNPTWTESYDESYEYFMELVSFAERLLERVILRAEAQVKGQQKVLQAYQDADDKRIIMLDAGYPWRDVLLAFPEPRFVIYPETDTERFMIQAVYQARAGYEIRTRFPEAWGGLTNEALSAVTGISGSRFCHTAGFLAVHDTRDGAYALAQLALQEQENK